jgi:hypothetical protein
MIAGVCGTKSVRRFTLQQFKNPTRNAGRRSALTTVLDVRTDISLAEEFY